MQNSYDPMRISVGHKGLFSSTVSIEEIVETFSKYPIEQWLDFFAKIEGFLLIKRDSIPSPQTYLANNILTKGAIDRFNRRYCKKDIFFSPGQINLARKMAIIYGQNKITKNTPHLFNFLQSVEISRLLLGVQDLHNNFDNHNKPEEDNLEDFCKFIVRNGYLNSPIDTVQLLIRTSNMYVELVKKDIPFPLHKNGFCDFFLQNVGISVEQAIALNFALANPFFQNEQELASNPTLINPDTYFEETKIDSRVINSIIANTTIDLLEAQKKLKQEIIPFNFESIPVGYNLDLFRKTPLIRLYDGRLACANLACMFEKTTQNIIWLPKNGMMLLEQKAIEKNVTGLMKYRGQLFEEYVKMLCNIMSEKNKKIKFYYVPPEQTELHQEVGDAILIQDNKIIILEAKSRQFKEKFKYTGDWNKDKKFIEEITNKSVNQIQSAAEKILQGKVPKIPINPHNIKKIYPVVVTYDPIPTHAKMQKFIREQVFNSGYLKNQIFAPLEIINISDLEAMMDVMESYSLIDILEQKNNAGNHASETNFKNFFALFASKNTILSTGWQKNEYDKVWQNVIRPNLPFKKEEDNRKIENKKLII